MTFDIVRAINDCISGDNISSKIDINDIKTTC